MRFNSSNLTIKRRTAVVATDFLRRDDKMAALLPAIERMASLQKDCAAALPAMFKYADILAFEAGLLTLALPNRSLVAKREVARVTLPGRDGVFGTEKNSPPVVAELAPGLVRVDYLDATSEEFFIPGGFAFKHANNSMDVSTVEGVKLDTVDVDALRAANADAVKRRDAAEAGSKPHAEAKLAIEVYRTLGLALKIAL